jgi:hypothetical protein
VDKVTDLKSIYCWSIEKDLCRETIIKFFGSAFNFEEINNCSFDSELFIQIWKEDKSHTARKTACLQKLKEKIEILGSRRNRFECIPKNLEMKRNSKQKLLNYREKEVEKKDKYKPYKITDNWSEEDKDNDDYLTPQRVDNYFSNREKGKI